MTKKQAVKLLDKQEENVLALLAQVRKQKADLVKKIRKARVKAKPKIQYDE